MSETNNSNITTGVSMAVSTDMTKKYTGISTRDLAADASQEIVNHRNKVIHPFDINSMFKFRFNNVETTRKCN